MENRLKFIEDSDIDTDLGEESEEGDIDFSTLRLKHLELGENIDSEEENTLDVL